MNRSDTARGIVVFLRNNNSHISPKGYLVHNITTTKLTNRLTKIISVWNAIMLHYLHR